MTLALLQHLLVPIFGTFETEEFKKFLRMGLVFSLILASYSTLVILKNTIFCNLVGVSEIPWAKTAWIFCSIPILMGYSQLITRYKQSRAFFIIASFYVVVLLCFALALTSASIGQASYHIIAERQGTFGIITKILGYAWFLLLESYGSIIITLFWSIAADTTKPTSAQQGFYFITALGQIGGIIAPFFLAKLPRLFGLNSSAISVTCCALITGAAIIAMKQLFDNTPPALMTAYHGINEQEQEKKQKPGFFEGLVLIKNPYLLSIFLMITIYGILVTIFDFQFQLKASLQYTDTDLTEYLGFYASTVNFVTFLFLIIGISNIPKYFGNTITLAIAPLIFCGALIAFSLFDSLTFLMILMITSKTASRSLNAPIIKQLYIPTTHDVRYKAKAWIDAFGTGGAKEIGSLFNIILKPLQFFLGSDAGRIIYTHLSVYLGLILAFVWLFLAHYVGKTHEKAIKNNEVVC